MVNKLSCSTWEELQQSALRCTACDLGTTRTQVVFGSGPKNVRLVIIGEAPGAEEDRQGLPFVGRSGALLDRLLNSVGIARAEVYIANVIKCRPPDNRNPSALEIATCRPFLEAQLEFLRPEIIVPLGNFATRFILNTKVGITKLRGQVIDLPAGSTGTPPHLRAVVIPVLHPAAVLRGGEAAFSRAQVDFAVIAQTLSSRLAS